MYSKKRNIRLMSLSITKENQISKNELYIYYNIAKIQKYLIY